MLGPPSLLRVVENQIWRTSWSLRKLKRIKIIHVICFFSSHIRSKFPLPVFHLIFFKPKISFRKGGISELPTKRWSYTHYSSRTAPLSSETPHHLIKWVLSVTLTTTCCSNHRENHIKIKLLQLNQPHIFVQTLTNNTAIEPLAGSAFQSECWALPGQLSYCGFRPLVLIT